MSLLTELVILRHSPAGERAQWPGHDHHRPLDSDGLAQSLLLVDSLAGRDLDGIVTSAAVRCHHTVAPLAASRRLPVATAQWLEIGACQADIEDGLVELTGRILLCTHGECVERLLAALGTTHRLPQSVDPELEKGAALVLSIGDQTPRIERLKAPGTARARALLDALGLRLSP